MQPDTDAAWDTASASMVDDLLRGSGSLSEEAAAAGVLDRMACLCLQRLGEQPGGVMRKSDLGAFLKRKLGREYRRGWLKVAMDLLKHQGRVMATACDVALVTEGGQKGGTGPRKDGGRTGARKSFWRWCRFSNACRYIVNVSENAKHFDSYVHLCPLGLRCRFVTAHLLGLPAGAEAEAHFRRWKHACPQGERCVYSADVDRYREHFNVFCHRSNVVVDGRGENHCPFSAAVPHVRDDAAQHAADGGYRAP